MDGDAGAVPLQKGVPQGSPISPLLANFFLEDFDRTLEAAGRKLIRYADDEPGESGAVEGGGF